MSVKRTYALGIDMGATTVKAGVVDLKGNIIDQFTTETRAMKGPKAVVQQITLAIHEIFNRHKQTECFGIGIGAPGVVRVEDGSVNHPPNFADWGEVPLAGLIRKSYPLPVFIENDANCAAIAESRFGAGVDYKDFLFVIWGTGVGGGIILDRKIYRGPFGGAGEVGHTTIDYEGRLCGCGNHGCVEAYIGQRHMSQRTREILSTLPKETGSKILTLVEGNLDRIEPAIIAQAAQQGDRVATDILTEAGQLMGVAMASILNVLDLRVVIIGGGISASPQFVFDAIEETIKSRVLKSHLNGVKVLRAKLGNPAGIIGAASLVM